MDDLAKKLGMNMPSKEDQSKVMDMKMSHGLSDYSMKVFGHNMPEESEIEYLENIGQQHRACICKIVRNTSKLISDGMISYYTDDKISSAYHLTDLGMEIVAHLK